MLLVGTVICRLLILSILMAKSKQTHGFFEMLKFAFIAIFFPLSTEIFERLTLEMKMDNDVEHDYETV